ncbi:MAG: dUTP diphosphatase [Ruminococcaceae bacterium]|nr:dUTP diphosphatase [Oscillospiraceae bacterium]
MKTEVKIKKMRESAIIPEYATSGSAALDLRCAADESIVIPARSRAAIPTGIAVAPEDSSVVSIVCARSGLATKHGIALANGIGVIDSDYRGEIIVSLINNSDVDFTVEPGDRVAQLMFMPVLTANLIECVELDKTERGAGGFGSTGVK